MALWKCRRHSLGYLGSLTPGSCASSNLYEVSHAFLCSLVLRTGICRSSLPPSHPQSWLAWCRLDLEPAPGLWEAQLQLTWPCPQRELKPLTPGCSSSQASGKDSWGSVVAAGCSTAHASLQGRLYPANFCLSVFLWQIGWSGKGQI